MSCIRNYYLSDNTVCSNHGSCIHDECTCVSGWISRADMEFSRTYECDINVSVIKSLSSLILIVGTFGIFAIIRKLYQHPIKSYADITAGRNLMLLAGLGCYFSAIILSIAKIIDTESNVLGGSNTGSYPVTIGYVSFHIISPIITTGMLSRLSKFLDGYSKILKTEYRNNLNKRTYIINKMIIFIFLISFVGAWLPFIAISYPQYNEIILRTIISFVSMVHMF